MRYIDLKESDVKNDFTERMGVSFVSFNRTWKLLSVNEEPMHHPDDYNLVTMVYAVPDGAVNFNDLMTFRARVEQTVKGATMFTVKGHGDQVTLNFVYTPKK